MKYLDSELIRNVCSIVIDRVGDPFLDVPAELRELRDWKGGDIVYYKQDTDNNFVFCHSEFLNYISALNIDLSNKVLITHHSDANVQEWDGNKAVFTLGPSITYEVENLNPIKWLARNACCDTIQAIPCGLYGERYGKMDMIKKLESINLPKEHMIYVNFNPNSNLDRIECLKYVGLPNHYNQQASISRLDIDESVEYNFLSDVKKSYFVASPNGFGVDCHRHWECFQLGAIPIVTDSPLIRQLSKYYPFYVVDQWSSFNNSIFTKELYEEMWNKFDKNYLDLDYLINKILA